ncbi:MAG: 1-deoxy-D-xylulose-5-phosphate synthase [Clostridiales bacterium]|nr:1-deoxy-D-xylulose-5-phosphate synthase [Clostridiales bacterium]
MNEFKYVDKIKSPDDVKAIDEKELPILAEEVRKVLIDTVSKTGGHLASNLGVVELTIALHRVFDSPQDQIVWDVGHQVYTHKLFTGRYDDFSTLRQQGGLSGFSRPYESRHDIFFSGHSSTSISAAYGLSSAKTLNNDKHHVIAVIGDGALTGGLAYEGLNNAGRSKDRLIVILNDNKMSISKNVGSLAKHLAVVRSKPLYFKAKNAFAKFIVNIPFIGQKLKRRMLRIKAKLKNIIFGRTIFEDMGFRYMGPINGHNIELLIDALESAKNLKTPVLIHINTIKGRGYNHAEENPSDFHGVSKFDINTGDPIYVGSNFSAEFGKYLCSLAENDGRICAVTAAMSLGTGLDEFSEKYPKRFFDVGIAEEHAVTFSSGLSKDGMLPVFAVYSSFLQRCYDQLVHDVSLQGLKVILGIDRAGFVGEDGESHNGLLDVALLNSIPKTTVYSPATYKELQEDLYKAFYEDGGFVAVRYPRGAENALADEIEINSGNFDVFGEENAKIVIATYGRLFFNAYKAMKKLKENGIDVKILKLNRIIPIDKKSVSKVENAEKIYFFEEGIKSGGVGEHFACILLEKGYTGQYKIVAVENQYVAQASTKELMKKFNFDCDGMVKIITEGE